MRLFIVMLLMLALAAPTYALDLSIPQDSQIADARTYRGQTDYREEFNKCADRLVTMADERRKCTEELKERDIRERFLWTVIGMFIIYSYNSP